MMSERHSAIMSGVDERPHVSRMTLIGAVWISSISQSALYPIAYNTDGANNLKRLIMTRCIECI